MNGYAFAILAVFAVAAGIGVRWRLPRPALVAVAVAPWLAAMALIAHYRRGVLVLQSPINPDEALFLANAIKAMNGGWRPWIDVDPGTVGVLVPNALIPGLLVAPDAPYLVARVVAIVCIVGMAAGLALALRRAVGWLPAQLAASPVLVLAVIPGWADLYTYSSELLPLALALLGVGIAIDAAGSSRMRWGRFALGYLLVGSVVFAKLQIAPVAAVWGLAVLVVAVLEVRRSERLRVAGLAIAAGLAPAGVVALIALISPQLRSALASSASFVGSYSGAGSDRRGTLDQFLEPPVTEQLMLLGTFAAVAAATVLLASQRVRRVPGAAAPLALTLAAPVGVLAMVAPGRYFPHYLWVGIVPAVVALVVLIAIAIRVWTGDRQVQWAFALMAVVGALVLLGTERRFTVDVKEPGAFVVQGWTLTPLASPEQRQVADLLVACPDPEIAVWGWDPGIFVIAERPHWSRAAAILAPDDPFAREWVETAGTERPLCIVDASGPQQFVFSGDWAHLDRQPGGTELLEAYDLVFSGPNYRVYRIAEA